MNKAAAPGEGAKVCQNDGGGPEGVAAAGKGAGCQHPAVVAHRALFGVQRRRANGGRKMGSGGKSSPSRLSRVSTAEDGTN